METEGISTSLTMAYGSLKSQLILGNNGRGLKKLSVEKQFKKVSQESGLVEQPLLPTDLRVFNRENGRSGPLLLLCQPHCLGLRPRHK